MHPRRLRPTTLLMLLCSTLLLQACNGGLMVTPTGPSSGGDPNAPPPATDIRVTLFVSGTLADGGSFDGFLTYNDRDLDAREDFGRFQAGLWEMVIRGGSRTRDVRFANGTGGRALIETNSLPFPAIGLIFLWPDSDPAQQALTPHVLPRPGYDPDFQPTLRDFGALIPGAPGTFGAFVDGQGGESLVTSLQIR